MNVKHSVLPALAAALLVSACDTPIVQDGLAVTRNATLLPFSKPQPVAPETLPVAWEVLASPVSIARSDASAPKGATSRIGGHAALKVTPHIIPQRYTISWSGLRDSTATAPTRVTLRDPQGDRAIVLQFEQNRLRVINGAEDSFPKLTFSPDETHHVTLVVTMGAKPTVAIDMRQGKLPLYATPPVAVLDAGFDSLGALEIEVSAKNTTYHLKDFKALPSKG